MMRGAMAVVRPVALVLLLLSVPFDAEASPAHTKAIHNILSHRSQKRSASQKRETAEEHMMHDAFIAKAEALQYQVNPAETTKSSSSAAAGTSMYGGAQYLRASSTTGAKSGGTSSTTLDIAAEKGYSTTSALSISEEKEPIPTTTSTTATSTSTSSISSSSTAGKLPQAYALTYADPARSAETMSSAMAQAQGSAVKHPDATEMQDLPKAYSLSTADPAKSADVMSKATTLASVGHSLSTSAPEDEGTGSLPQAYSLSTSDPAKAADVMAQAMAQVQGGVTSGGDLIHTDVTKADLPRAYSLSTADPAKSADVMEQAKVLANGGGVGEPEGVTKGDLPRAYSLSTADPAKSADVMKQATVLASGGALEKSEVVTKGDLPRAYSLSTADPAKSADVMKQATMLVNGGALENSEAVTKGDLPRAYSLSTSDPAKAAAVMSKAMTLASVGHSLSTSAEAEAEDLPKAYSLTTSNPAKSADVMSKAVAQATGEGGYYEGGAKPVGSGGDAKAMEGVGIGGSYGLPTANPQKSALVMNQAIAQAMVWGSDPTSETSSAATAKEEQLPLDVKPMGGMNMEGYKAEQAMSEQPKSAAVTQSLGGGGVGFGGEQYVDAKPMEGMDMSGYKGNMVMPESKSAAVATTNAVAAAGYGSGTTEGIHGSEEGEDVKPMEGMNMEGNRMNLADPERDAGDAFQELAHALSADDVTDPAASGKAGAVSVAAETEAPPTKEEAIAEVMKGYAVDPSDPGGMVVPIKDTLYADPRGVVVPIKETLTQEFAAEVEKATIASAGTDAAAAAQQSSGNYDGKSSNLIWAQENGGR